MHNKGAWKSFFYENLEPDPVILFRLLRPDELWINEREIGIEKT